MFNISRRIAAGSATDQWNQREISKGISQINKKEMVLVDIGCPRYCLVEMVGILRNFTQGVST